MAVNLARLRDVCDLLENEPRLAVELFLAADDFLFWYADIIKPNAIHPFAHDSANRLARAVETLRAVTNPPKEKPRA